MDSVLIAADLHGIVHAVDPATLKVYCGWPTEVYIPQGDAGGDAPVAFPMEWCGRCSPTAYGSPMRALSERDEGLDQPAVGS